MSAAKLYCPLNHCRWANPIINVCTLFPGDWCPNIEKRGELVRGSTRYKVATPKTFFGVHPKLSDGGMWASYLVLDETRAYKSKLCRTFKDAYAAFRREYDRLRNGVVPDFWRDGWSPIELDSVPPHKEHKSAEFGWEKKKRAEKRRLAMLAKRQEEDSEQ